jgi:hypothetical protein
VRVPGSGIRDPGSGIRDPRCGNTGNRGWPRTGRIYRFGDSMIRDSTIRD